jgi:hypothetical protein
MRQRLINFVLHYVAAAVAFYVGFVWLRPIRLWLLGH